MAARQVPPLSMILAEVPDPRQPRGRRHPIGAMLTLLCLAMLCGRRNVLAVSEWGPDYGAQYGPRLAFGRHGYPSRATWYRLLQRIDVAAFEAKLAEWVTQVLDTLGADRSDGISIDGKTLRTSRKQGAKGAHLLAAASYWMGLVLAEMAVDDKTNEIGEIQQLLVTLALEGMVVTVDALLAQRDVTETIVAAGGDFVVPIKDNQARTRRAIAVWFAQPPPVNLPANRVAQTVDKAHGRIEHRRLEATTVLNDYLEWPSVAQAFRLTRRRVHLATGQAEQEVHYGVTSLTPDRASPDDLLRYVRDHWTIENRVHWVRDVTFDEDRCQLRAGHAHQLMAAARNLIIGLARIHGHDNIASALRHYAARPAEALALISSPVGVRE